MNENKKNQQNNTNNILIFLYFDNKLIYYNVKTTTQNDSIEIKFVLLNSHNYYMRASRPFKHAVLLP